MIREWNRGEWTRDSFSEAGVFAPKQHESETDKDPFNPKASYLAKRSFSSRPASPNLHNAKSLEFDWKRPYLKSLGLVKEYLRYLYQFWVRAQRQKTVQKIRLLEGRLMGNPRPTFGSGGIDAWQTFTRGVHHHRRPLASQQAFRSKGRPAIVSTHEMNYDAHLGKAKFQGLDPASLVKYSRCLASL
jgi:hypothetical protein